MEITRNYMIKVLKTCMRIKGPSIMEGIELDVIVNLLPTLKIPILNLIKKKKRCLLRVLVMMFTS